MHVLRIQVGLPRQIEMPAGALRTAFFKEPVDGPLWLGAAGLAGDGQANRKHHGGPDKALLACGIGHLHRYREVLALPDLGPGAFGENLTLSAADEAAVCLGDRYTIGDAVVEVTQPREPCRTLARALGVPNLVARMRREGGGGFYLRVLQEGLITPGQEVRLLLRQRPGETVLQSVAERARLRARTPRP